VDVISVQEKKYMKVTRKPTNNKMLKLDDQQYQRAKEFKYLGKIVTDDNDIKQE
jgi:hypothetical protein